MVWGAPASIKRSNANRQAFFAARVLCCLMSPFRKNEGGA